MSEIILVVLLWVVVMFHFVASERVSLTGVGRDTCGETPVPVAPQQLHLWPGFSWYILKAWPHLAVLVRPVIAGGDAGYPICHLFHQRHFSAGDFQALAGLVEFWLFNWVVALCYRAAVFALLGSPTARTPKASTLCCTPPTTCWSILAPTKLWPFLTFGVPCILPCSPHSLCRCTSKRLHGIRFALAPNWTVGWRGLKQSLVWLSSCFSARNCHLLLRRLPFHNGGWPSAVKSCHFNVVLENFTQTKFNIPTNDDLHEYNRI